MKAQEGENYIFLSFQIPEIEIPSRPPQIEEELPPKGVCQGFCHSIDNVREIE